MMLANADWNGWKVLVRIYQRRLRWLSTSGEPPPPAWSKKQALVSIWWYEDKRYSPRDIETLMEDGMKFEIKEKSSPDQKNEDNAGLKSLNGKSIHN